MVLAKLVYVLGIVNLTGLALVLFTCRCTLGRFSKLWNIKWYQKFYNLHCYYWWIFLISVFLHATLALIVYGNPF